MSGKNIHIDKIHIIQGDITQMSTDSIVNAANTSLLGGGGVDGAIHRSAGPGLLKECEQFDGCKPGEARITKGYCLKSSYIIHTPGPIYRGGNSGEAEVLRNSYWNSLALAKDNNLKSISFPAISTGVYHYPLEEACSIAITTALEFMGTQNYNLDIYFVLFDKANFNIYNNFISNYQKNDQ